MTDDRDICRRHGLGKFYLTEFGAPACRVCLDEQFHHHNNAITEEKEAPQ